MSVFSSPFNEPFHNPFGSPFNGPGIGGGGWTPAQWFLASEQGVWYDPSDMSTLFQDSAGLTPVTAVEQPVGLALDKRLGAIAGPELLVNGNFDTDTDWAKGTGWSISGGRAIHTGATADYLKQSVTTTGMWYECRIDVAVANGSNFPQVYLGDAPAVASPVAPGVYTYRGRAPGSLLGFAIRGVGACEVNSFSVKQLPGNHASQPTTAAKPKLRLDGANYYNYFDRVDDHLTVAAGGGGTTGIIVCAAIRAGDAGNARTIWSDRGTNTGYRLSVNATNQLVLSAGNGAAHTEVVGPTITAGTDYVVTGWHDGANLNVQANAGAATSAAFGTATAGTAGFTIGKDNGAATSYYSERIYEIVYRKDDASTAGDRTTLINYMAAQAGITL